MEGGSMARWDLGPFGSRIPLFVAVLTFGLIFVPELKAGDKGTEQRDFNILVDGSQAGAYSMSITEHDDGSETMSASANVKVSYFGGLKTYRYSYQGAETWKAGRIVRFNSSSNDDGKEFNVSAASDAAGLRLRVNGRDRTVRPDVWLSTYWHLADPRFRNQGVPLLDADTGKDLAAKLQYLGARQLMVAGKAQKCTHYQLTGEVQAELWYDAQERLISLKSISDGHHYELILTGIGR
jgi:hypothetical protein